MANDIKTPQWPATGPKMATESDAEYVKRCVKVCRLANEVRRRVAEAYGLEPHECHDSRRHDEARRAAVDTMTLVYYRMGFTTAAIASATYDRRQTSSVQERVARLKMLTKRDDRNQVPEQWRTDYICTQVYGALATEVERW
jgi:AraC-like DNA-binding protein